jgi:predicted outer membrane protein
VTTARGISKTRTTRVAAGILLAAVALTGAVACSAGGDQAPAMPTGSAAPAPGGSANQANDATRAAYGQANQGALALVALGGLGTDKGVGDQVRGLAPDLTSQGQALLDQVKQAATAAGVALGDQLGAQQQALIADLQARSGQPFDTAWLQAAQTLLSQARDAANAILNDPNASPEAKAAARDALAKLDALAKQLSSASSSAGASTPGSVDAGTGGQAAASDDLLPIVLGGSGLVLLGGGGVVAARSRRSRTDV